jgi:hypothetical protein
MLAWVERQTNSYNIFVYDLETTEKTKIHLCDSCDHYKQVAIDGRFVTWEVLESDGIHHNIRFYDSLYSAYGWVMQAVGDQINQSVSDGVVIWEDARLGRADTDIWMYDIPK